MIVRIGSEVQGLNYLFRSDPQKFSDKFQQLRSMGECGPEDFGQNAIQMQEYNIQFNCHPYYLH